MQTLNKTLDNSPILTASTITFFKAQNELEQKLNQAWRMYETEAVSKLLPEVKLSAQTANDVQILAQRIAKNLRERKASSGKSGVVQGLLQEFSLSSGEGVALMCLAEALLRIPDKNTRDLLIKDKINQGNWKEHLGQSDLMFVNAATWGLIITDKLVATPSKMTLSALLTKMIGRFGKAIIRKSVDTAMRIMGEQFVTGETIHEALNNAKILEEKGFKYSYDMLGEAALTEHDAERYFKDYVNAIKHIGMTASGKSVYESAGISIKLSALHPRYQRAQIERVHTELYPKLLILVELAKHYNIGINIDAEESERLELSLGLLERLCHEPSLVGWHGIGFVIQAYQKRCFYLIDYIIDLAKKTKHRLMIRLVKGAYWDSEIKKAQIEGVTTFPVFTRKVYTDLSYLACAKKLLAAKEQIFPQFATHNAQTLSAIYYMAKPETYHKEQYEFQCLHGMGEPLYEQVVGNKKEGKLGIPCRIYAPVGTHETLLAYLVRRLLENGANTSFVNRIADKTISIEELVASPFDEVEQIAKAEGVVGRSHAAIAYPKTLYGKQRKNSDGYDLNNDRVLVSLTNTVNQLKNNTWYATPLLADYDEDIQQFAKTNSIKNPAQHSDIVGYVSEAQVSDVGKALTFAETANTTWATTPVKMRASFLQQAADQLEVRIEEFMILLARESGKTYANGIAEVREAIDFLRYYAAQAIDLNSANSQPLGTVLCISPWNFPLAIFLGQISAALVAGNTVIAKPAEQTPLVATLAIKLLWQAGIPKDVVQLLPGQGETIGAALSKDERINGIMFTGSTEVAKILQRTVARRITKHGQSIPLIAETGGQNAMIVDSSALTEQVVLDIVSSAFDSAGQRCSALRLLCVQEDSYENVINMLKGATQQLYVGNPLVLSNDIGPVIDEESKQNILQHIAHMQSKGYATHQICFNPKDEIQKNKNSTFVLPTIVELPHLDELTREIFGPVLHVIKFKYGELDSLLDAINDKGYGLTMGLHTRIDETIRKVVAKAHVGNLYINRNIVGAVVGVQPFGGEGLSGTGPKAGGPLYLHKLMANANDDVLQQPFGVVRAMEAPPKQSNTTEFAQWMVTFDPSFQLAPLSNINHVNKGYELPGPTGESNSYYVLPREAILAFTQQLNDQIQQVHTILALGSQVAILANSPFAKQIYPKLPESLQARFQLAKQFEDIHCDAIIHHGTTDELQTLQMESAQKLKNIVTIVHLKPDQQDIPLAHLVHERAISINTAAAGGNTSLMMLES